MRKTETIVTGSDGRINDLRDRRVHLSVQLLSPLQGVSGMNGAENVNMHGQNTAAHDVRGNDIMC
eukprot:6477103-Amphidinium_carterae.1